MKLIIGLGNPGSRYAGTRHNVGFRVVDAFADKFRISVTTREHGSETGKGRVAGRSVVLAKPQTFMNLSGEAVRKLVGGNAIDLMDVIVIYDDIDLPVGRLRIRKNGSSGTHNGMRSIVASLGTESFPRLRFGIRGETWSPRRDLADYVLEDFDSDEEVSVRLGIDRAIDALLMIVRDDLGRAMTEFNRDPKPAGEAPDTSEGD